MPANLGNCIDWAYELYYKSLNAADARTAARRSCKQTDLKVARLLYPFYFKTLNAADATTAALKAGSHPILATRTEILHFAMEHYYKSLNGKDAANKAVQQALRIPISISSRVFLSCLETEFPIYFRTLSGQAAMTKSFGVCRE